jgi:hypothetical protein
MTRIHQQYRRHLNWSDQVRYQMSVQLHIHTPDDECTKTPLAISSSEEPSTAVFTVYHHQNCGLADKSLSV